MARTGSYRHYVSFQSPGGERDDVGERDTEFTTVFECYVRIEPLTAFELDAASQARSGRTHRVFCRDASELSSLDESWRIVYGTRVFVIEGIRNLGERDRELEITCVEGLKLE